MITMIQSKNIGIGQKFGIASLGSIHMKIQQNSYS